MDTHEIKTTTANGTPVTISLPIIGYNEQTGEPILALRQPTDAEWNALAQKKALV